jgi:hypothetical protein
LKKQLIAMVILGVAADAQGAEYDLFHPVPEGKLRPFTAERPSKSDSINTVDAGHYVVETSFVSATRDKECTAAGCVRTRQSAFGQGTNVRIGLASALDLQIITDLYTHERVEDRTAGLTQRRDGLGDTVLRLKYNVLGNDGGNGFALIPYVKLPTNQNGLGNSEMEGGLGIPFLLNFPDGWSLGGTTQVDFLARQEGMSGYDLSYDNVAILGKTLTESTAVYAELFTSREDTGGAEWQNTADVGVTYAVTDHFILDSAVNVGITKAADDLNWCVGGSYRF